MTEYNILDFGAVGDGLRDNAQAIQKTIDQCHQNGGGTVVIPAGFTFTSGPFQLKSTITFFVQKGAILLANPDESVYTQSAFRDNKKEGMIWIGGENIENVSITGEGIIDGNGVSFMGAEEKEAYDLKPFKEVDVRPHILTLVNCRNINIHNITFQNAAYWGLHFVGCQNILISQIFLFNSLKIRNGDGIDLDHSQNVNISNCHIESGDDCICFKNRREYAEFGPCSDITITGCTLTSTSCAIKFGSENMDAIKNVVINNCIIKNSNRGIGIQNRDEGTISNILISNIILECRLFSDVWWGKAEPIYITAFPRANHNDKDGGLRFPVGVLKGKVGKISHITFSNIQCISENGIFVGAEDLSKISHIQFNNIDLQVNKTTQHKGGLYDCRPCKGQAMIVDNTVGFYLMNASNIQIKDCNLWWGPNRMDYYTTGISKINCQNVTIINYNYPKNEAILTGNASNQEILSKLSNK